MQNDHYYTSTEDVYFVKVMFAKLFDWDKKAELNDSLSDYILLA